MTVGVLSACHKLRGKVVRGALERCVFAAIGLSLAATSIGALGADLTTGSFRPTTVSSHVMGTGHQSVTAPPSARPDAELDHLATHARTIDRTRSVTLPRSRERRMGFTQQHAQRQSTCATTLRPPRARLNDRPGTQARCLAHRRLSRPETTALFQT